MNKNIKLIKQRRDQLLSFLYISKIRLAVAYWLLVLILILLLQPIKAHAWDEIKLQGDNALSQRQFAKAKVEYQKLRLLNFSNNEPYNLYHLVYLGEQNVMNLKTFYEARSDITQLNLLNLASADYESPEAALASCQKLNVANDGVLAIYCINKTLTTWPMYRDGWLTAMIFAEKYGDDALVAQSKQILIELDPMLADSL
jgi:hypothetical protein